MAWSDWREVENDGTVPEELLPAEQWQYKWMIHHEFDLGGGGFLDRGQGTITMQWRTRFGSHLLHDTAKFSFTSLADPLDPGFLAAQYTYWLGSGETVREEGTATQGGDERGQLVFSAQGPTWAFGISEGFFWGELIGDVWVGEIGEAEKVQFVSWYPNLYIPHGKQLWIRTLSGEEPMQQTVLDPATHSKHEFWLDGKTLLHRMQMSADGRHTGLQAGGAITARTGGGYNVGAGVAIIEQQERSFEAQELSSSVSGRVLVAEFLGELAIQVDAGEPYDYPHAGLGRVTSAGVITQTRDTQGTAICDNVTEFSAWIEDDGKLKVNVGKASERRQFVSMDRGGCWGEVV